ncbi:MAG TPA: alanine racemase [Terriglobales bacterium]|jgi:alanine racemase|nr:alanine racemase [Terriglobales bacterium]
MPTRPTWAEVSLPTLVTNYKLIRDFVAPHAAVCAVVKCDAYGHGGVECARALEAAGASWFGVTSADEGIELRRAGIAGRILLMSGIWRGEGEAVVEHSLTPAVWSAEQISELNRAADKLRKDRFPVHIEVDTGMARQGVSAANLGYVLEAARKAKSICIEGLHSHLASAEVVDAPDVEAQLTAYQRALEQLAAAHIRPACLHLANSAAVVARKESWHGLRDSTALVRPGISLYGYYLPFVTALGVAAETQQPRVKPVLSWKTRIIDIRDIEAGQGVGYNLTSVAKAPSRIATLAVGYGDGLSRALSNRGQVLIRGDFAPIVGKVSMDVTTVDITKISGAQIGDEVVLIGEQNGRRITAADLAAGTQTIAYEVLCNIGKRVPRRYV